MRTEDSLLAVLAHVRDAAWPADVIAATGDLIQDDSRDAYRRFRRHFAELGLPVHCVPGNHDIRELMQAELAGEPFHYCAGFRHGSWLMQGIDSCKAGSAGGAVSDEELARLLGAIEKSDAAHVLVCLHHPPLPMHSRWLDTVGLDDGRAFVDALAGTGRVRGILFGHVHQPFDETVAGIRILGTPSTCRQFLPRSDDFALDERPPAYRRVTLGDDGSIDEELVWVEAPRARVAS